MIGTYADSSTAALGANVITRASESFKYDYSTDITIYDCSLYQDTNNLDLSKLKVLKEESYTNAKLPTRFEFSPFKLWNAEAPYLYAVKISLKDDEGNVLDSQITHFGLRTSKISDGLLKINDTAILFKGTNRHDNNPKKGRAISSDDVKHDLLLMKQHNLNAIRCSHYPSHPALLYWADILGFYVIAEADLECHGFTTEGWIDGSTVDNFDRSSKKLMLPTERDSTSGHLRGASQRSTFYNSYHKTYGDANGFARSSSSLANRDSTSIHLSGAPQNITSNNPDWKDIYIDRVSSLYNRDNNHPSVIMWSLGNESFYGSNHDYMYKWLKERRPSFPVHYEGDWGGNRMDVYSVMYPSLEFVKYQGSQENFTKPLVLCEYAHSMGNGPGGLLSYQKLFEKYPRLQGGFIWEWASHGLEKTSPNGRKYYAYGGDFGERVHDSTFVLDGICFSDHTPTPGLLEYKYVIQPARLDISLIDHELYGVELSNLHDFIRLKDFELHIEVEIFPPDPIPSSEARKQSFVHSTFVHHRLRMAAPKGNTVFLECPEVPELDKIYGTCCISAYLKYSTDRPWAETGHIVAFDQLYLNGRAARYISKIGKNEAGTSAWKVSKDARCYTFANGYWTISFELASGIISSVTRKGIDFFSQNPTIGFWRAPTDNDKGGDKWKWQQYHVHNLADFHCLEFRHSESDGVLSIFSKSQVRPPVVRWGIQFTIEYTLSIKDNLEINFDILMDPIGNHCPTVPRIGLDFVLASELQSASWLGLGPGESYPDSKVAQRLGIHTGTSKDFFTNYEVPQDNGNRSGVRWVDLSLHKSTSEFDENTSVDEEQSLISSTPSTPGAWSIEEFESELSDIFVSQSEKPVNMRLSAIASGTKKDNKFINFSLQPWNPYQLEAAAHPYQLNPKDCRNNFRVDFDVHGLGSASCGPGVEESFKLKLQRTNFAVKFIFHDI